MKMVSRVYVSLCYTFFLQGLYCCYVQAMSDSMLLIGDYANLRLASTNHAVELLVRIIGRAGHAIAGRFHMVEKHSILVAIVSRNTFRASIDTLKHCTTTDVIRQASTFLCHEVAIVLSCPSRRTVSFGWDHHNVFSRMCLVIQTAQGTLGL